METHTVLLDVGLPGARPAGLPPVDQQQGQRVGGGDREGSVGIGEALAL